MLSLIGKEISSTQATIAELTERIKKALAPYENALELLKKVPGISAKSAQDLVVEIGLEISVFPSEKHLAYWAGISPGNNESAGKKKRTYHSRQQAGKNLTCRDSVGGKPGKRHILQGEVSQDSGTAR